ncbi:MAG TPA: phage integrase N-terminal SAM-like domain-containing protein [Methylocaldum sp.]|nr:phage integrase N-terminal SAM-like domain-containing protein [Methylocaldum sp.]HYE34139.1 phage integrase N-terminal SAM-like domain-containing protein [Methylocaldum sp.]
MNTFVSHRVEDEVRADAAGFEPSAASVGGESSAQAPRLLDQVREKIRLRHYSIRTEQAYVDWIRRFIVFHGKRLSRIWVLRRSSVF